MNKNETSMFKISTPNHDKFFVSLISKKEADSLESKYQKNKIKDEFLSTYKRDAYLINNGKVLYRQFYKSIGFVFPSINDFKKSVRSSTYFDVSLQPTDDYNHLIVREKDYSRIAASFSIMPAFGNNYLKDTVKELSEYIPFEGYNFYLLKNDSVVMLRKRTSELIEGYWFSSMRDFDFFYYVLSGKERPGLSI